MNQATCVCPSPKLHGPSCPLFAANNAAQGKAEVEKAQELFEKAKRRSFETTTVTANDCSSG
eukprot:CAMPEP_0173460232 /NCGR_PEP_ID=MMETSP1357-20121228/62767_1 /TAXON_ID=77926 /ORGANISM="Hemiselmis rufescens, Strain PCC563" /LENGTH=61 /DNA_ID=CAMNT_0014427783 /DNA_START=30 /DNA_END=215 /DNA_ORIENTATION=-